jgi:hypothetical protein
MSGLAEWERRARIGPVRSRIRRTRGDAVEFYRRHHGPLGEDRLWVPSKLPREVRLRARILPAHIPAKESKRGVLWNEI